MKKIKTDLFDDPPSNDKFEVPLSKKAYDEALHLASEILKNIELGEISLALIARRTFRLARLLNDFEMVKIMELESSGYPEIDVYEEDIRFHELERLARLANRLYFDIDGFPVFIPDAIEKLESEKKYIKDRRELPRDLNKVDKLQKRFLEVSEQIAQRRSFIHEYITKTYLELKYSKIAEDIFSAIKQNVDKKIGEIVPESIEKFVAIYQNLTSANPEDWSNAVHKCRRILKDLADAIYPPTKSIKKILDGKEEIIQLGEEKYINRIIEFITQKSESETYIKIVGSHLKFVEDRLDSILKGSHKGTHAKTDREEANRIVVYTYLLVGDILSLI
ncbi:MAG: hypothetical protein ACFFDF_09905 [Candidatus Odinarchaeota archaeon]